MNREEHLLSMTLDGLRNSVEHHMPTSPYRSYYQWAISNNNSQHMEFLQAHGVIQLVRMTYRLLDGLVGSADWERLAPYTLPMNVYQIYEIVSDNLAIGLANADTSDPSAPARRRILRKFNRTMVKKLSGDPQPAAHLMRSIKAESNAVSLFVQSLNPKKQRGLSATYLDSLSDVSEQQLENDIWPILVANVESCVALAQVMETYHSGDLICKGLKNRYRAVNDLLDPRWLNGSKPRLNKASTYAILVIPTLAYYIGVLGEIITPTARFPRIIENHLLSRALYEAAFLVRLLNDLGTWTLQLTQEQHQALATVLQLRSAKHTSPTTFAAGIALTIQDAHVLSRVHKDLQYGEFNVALHGLRGSAFDADAVLRFSENLAAYTRLYTRVNNRLRYHLSLIEDQLGQDWVGHLIMRFVRFHETLYSNNYTTEDGEYAI